MTGNKVKDEGLFWHYTSLAAFKEIICNQSLRLTLRQCSNDSTEGFILQRIFKDKRQLQLWDNISKLEQMATFAEYQHQSLVFCVTDYNKYNNTSWRLYGDNGRGVAIGFEKSKLIAWFEKIRISEYSNSQLLNHPVVYWNTKTTSINKFYKKAIDNPLFNPSKESEHSLETWYRLLQFTKTISFSYENEHRFAFIVKNREDLNKIKYRTTDDNRIVGYIDFCLREMLEHSSPQMRSIGMLPIKKIKLGPNNHNLNMIRALKNNIYHDNNSLGIEIECVDQLEAPIR